MILVLNRLAFASSIISDSKSASSPHIFTIEGSIKNDEVSSKQEVTLYKHCLVIHKPLRRSKTYSEMTSLNIGVSTRIRSVSFWNIYVSAKFQTSICDNVEDIVRDVILCCCPLMCKCTE